MPLTFAPGDKFGVMAFGNVGTDYFARRLELDLGNGFWAVNTPPFEVGDHWKEWIGSIYYRSISRANLWLLAKISNAKAPDVDDRENEDLRAAVNRWFVGLLLLGSPYYEDAYLLSGAYSSRGLEVRSYTQTYHYLISEGAKHLTIGEQHLREGLQIGRALSQAYASEDHMRVRRGIRIFLDGLRNDISVARLHHSMRGIEAIVNPRISRTGRDMVHRCQAFTGASSGAVQILDECYELRNKEEHLWNWEDALPYIASPVDRQAVMTRRVRQAEALARHVYCRILTSAPHTAMFADSEIDKFWAQQDHVRLAQWATRLDIAGVP